MCQTQDSARYWCRIGNDILDCMSKSQVLDNSTYILEDDCFSNNPSICHIFHQYDRRSVKIHHYCPFSKNTKNTKTRAFFLIFHRDKDRHHFQLHYWCLLINIDNYILEMTNYFTLVFWICIKQICQFVLVFVCLKSNTQAICFCYNLSVHLLVDSKERMLSFQQADRALLTCMNPIFVHQTSNKCSFVWLLRFSSIQQHQDDSNHYPLLSIISKDRI